MCRALRNITLLRKLEITTFEHLPAFFLRGKCQLPLMVVSHRYSSSLTDSGPVLNRLDHWKYWVVCIVVILYTVIAWVVTHTMILIKFTLVYQKFWSKVPTVKQNLTWNLCSFSGRMTRIAERIWLTCIQRDTEWTLIKMNKIWKSSVLQYVISAIRLSKETYNLDAKWASYHQNPVSYLTDLVRIHCKVISENTVTDVARWLNALGRVLPTHWVNGRRLLS